MIKQYIYKTYIILFLTSLVLVFFNCNDSKETNKSTTEVIPIPETISESEIFKINQFDVLPKNRGLTAEHFPISNERRIDLFMKHIENLKGGYIGVGTDQNLSFIAKARSEYAWLMDFDPVIVKVNQIHLYFIERSPDYSEFKKLWELKNKKTTYQLIFDKFSKEKDFVLYKQAFEIAHPSGRVLSRLRDLDAISSKFPLISFHNNPDEYTYLREMIQKGKIQAIPGNLRGNLTMKAIAESARKLRITIKVLYLSNAEDYFRYDKGFRENIVALPSDERSMVVRTLSVRARFFGFPDGEKYPEDNPFHYNVQKLDNMKIWMNFDMNFFIADMMKNHTKIEKGISIQNATPTEAGYKEKKSKKN